MVQKIIGSVGIEARREIGAGNIADSYRFQHAVAEAVDSSRTVRLKAANAYIYYVVSSEIPAFPYFIKDAGQKQNCVLFVQAAVGSILFKIGIEKLVYSAQGHGVPSLQDKGRVGQPYQLEGLPEGLGRIVGYKTAVFRYIPMIAFLRAFGVIQDIVSEGVKANAHGFKVGFAFFISLVLSKRFFNFP